MPAYLVHRLAGDQVLQKINGKIIEKDDFILGLQGGDLFFGYHSAFFERKSGLMLGGTLHFDKPKAFFEKSMQFIKEYKGDGKDALNSYFCGYITHYCVDKRLHPFVYAHAPNGKIHNRLEFMLDSWVLNDLRGMEAADYDIAREISKKTLHPAIGLWYRQMFKELYGLEVRADAPAVAQKYFAQLRKRLATPGIGFYTLALSIYLFTRKDARIFLHPKKRSQDYFTQEEYEGLKRDIEAAVDEAAEKVDLFMQYLNDALPLIKVTETFQNINFKGEAV